MKSTGRHFLQIPGPTNVPDRVLRAMDRPVIDHRGPEFAALTGEVFEGMQSIFQTSSRVVIFPSSGTGAVEAALVNTLSPGDRVVIAETGFFSEQPWRRVARNLGVEVDYLPGNWRRGASPEAIEARLADDAARAVKAVIVVHNETSTGVASRIGEVRRAMNRARHPALLIVDTVSSLAAIDYRHDEWEVDVSVCGSQKGLMLPPGLGFNAVSEKALAAAAGARLPRAYWDWRDIIKSNESGFYPYTPATNLLFGLREAIRMLKEEGLPNVFQRHRRLAEATRIAVQGWGLEVLCEDPREYSGSVTAVLMPEGHSADRLRSTILDRFDMSLGTGLGRLADRDYRIGHLGAFGDLMLAGALGGIEMGLQVAAVPHRTGGVTAALNYLATADAAAPVGSGFSRTSTSA
jgi:alanine-glyoxylate transaminase/serine-glyoxylate transaminase/serine-pyruvate transaminase